MVLMPACTKPFERIGVDLFGPIIESLESPASQQVASSSSQRPPLNKYIICFIDYLSRYVVALPLSSKSSAAVCEKFLEFCNLL